MDLSFNEEQNILRDNSRKFLEKEFSIDRVREFWEDEKGYSEDVWTRMAELGWMGLRIPEEFGGIELSFIELAILLEEMGRAAMPGPYLPTILAAEAIIDGGSDEQKTDYLEKIAMGEIRATLAFHEQDSGDGPAAITMPAAGDGDGFVLNGSKLFVLEGLVSELLIVAARTAGSDKPEHGITLFLVDADMDGVSKQHLVTMDGGRRQCEVVFENVKVPVSKVLGEMDKGWELLNRTLRKGALALAMEAVGGGQKALDISVAYAKERVQFDQPIGSFQAIKHQCAQMMMEVEGGRSVAYYAAAELDAGGKDAAVCSSVAKSFCCEAYRNATTHSIQILGAIGLTEEHEMHLYLKRAKMNECLFGDQAYHREELACLLEY